MLTHTRQSPDFREALRGIDPPPRFGLSRRRRGARQVLWKRKIGGGWTWCGWTTQDRSIDEGQRAEGKKAELGTHLAGTIFGHGRAKKGQRRLNPAWWMPCVSMPVWAAPGGVGVVAFVGSCLPLGWPPRMLLGGAMGRHILHFRVIQKAWETKCHHTLTHASTPRHSRKNGLAAAAA